MFTRAAADAMGSEDSRRSFLGWTMTGSGRAALAAIGLALALPTTACRPPDPAEVPLLGTLERDRIELAATAAEPLADVLVREGQTVEAGQILAHLDDRRLATSLEAARARVRGAEARVAELLRGGREERRTEARAALSADRSELDLARLEVARLERLVADDVAARDRLDAARTRVETLTARIDQDRARLDELLSGATIEQVGQAEAEVAAARAEVADLEIALDRLTLVAPAGATVEALPWEPGETPGVGRPVIVLLSRDRPWVRVHVPEERTATLAVGTLFRLEADGLDRTLRGCLRFLASDAAFTPHFALSEHDRHRLAFAAEIEVREPEDESRRLPTGLPVRAFPTDGETCRLDEPAAP